MIVARSTQLSISPRLWRAQTFIAALLLSLIFVFQLFVAQLPLRSILEYAVNDDTFYYLEVAARAARGQGFTFDGVNMTNGFQPVWGLLLTAVAYLVEDKVQLLRAAVAISALFNFGTGLLIFIVSRDLLKPPYIIFPLLVWASVQLSPVLSLSALETSINWFIFTVAVWRLVVQARQSEVLNLQATVLSSIGFGALCALLFLVRVDNVIYVPFIVFLSSSLLTWSSIQLRFSRKLLFVAFGIGTVALVIVTPYLLWNLFEHGGLLPVSGEVKRQYSYGYITQAMGGYFSLSTFVYSVNRVMTEFFWTLSHSLAILRGGEPFWLTGPLEFALLSGSLLLVVLASRIARTKVNGSKETSGIHILKRSLGDWLLVLCVFWLIYGALDQIAVSEVRQTAKLVLLATTVLVGSTMVFVYGNHEKNRHPLPESQKIVLWLIIPALLHLTILVYTVDYFLNYTHWYYANYFVIMALSAGILIEFTSSLLSGYSDRIRTVALAVLASWMILGFAVTLVVTFTRVSSPTREPPYQINAQYELAQWIDNELPEDAVIASFNAGVIGYFSNRSTINLDGLINNRAILPYLFGPSSITDYLDRVCPDYVADYTVRDIDPMTDMSEDDRFLGIEMSRLKPIHSLKSIDFAEQTRTLIVFEFLKENCR